MPQASKQKFQKKKQLLTSPVAMSQLVAPGKSRPPTPPSFDDLNAEVWLEIMLYIPLMQLLQLRLVSVKWRNFIEEMYSQMRYIKIFYSPNDVDIYCTKLQFYNLQASTEFMANNGKQGNHVLVVRQPKKAQIDLKSVLMRLFPSVSHLTVFYNHNALNAHAHEEILEIMEKLWNRLETLILFGVDKPWSERLWCFIEKQRFTLRQLHLFDLFQSPVPHFKFPKLLTHFSLVNYHGSIEPVLEMLSNRVKYLMLNSVSFRLEELEWLFKRVAPQLSASLIHLSLGYIRSEPDKLRNADNNSSDNNSHVNDMRKARQSQISQMLQVLSRELNHLENFDPGFATSLDLKEILSALSTMQRLRTVRLYLGFPGVHICSQTVDRLPVLRQVRTLHIDYLGVVPLLDRIVNRSFPNANKVVIFFDDEVLREKITQVAKQITVAECRVLRRVI